VPAIGRTIAVAVRVVAVTIDALLTVWIIVISVLFVPLSGVPTVFVFIGF
jgi:hypothetical protein